MDATIGVVSKILNMKFFSSWQIPNALEKDQELKQLQDKFKDLELSELAEIVQKDRRARLRNSYRREISGSELVSSIKLISAIAIVVAVAVLMAAVEGVATLGLIAIAVVLAGLILMILVWNLPR